MHRTSRLRAAAVSLAVIPSVVFSSSAVATAAPADQVELNILGITDFHGHIAEVVKDGAASEMGAAALACYLDKERAANPNTSFVSAGDNIGGSPFVSSILRDKPTLDALNTMGLEASAVGNHEFDQGWDDLNGRVSVDGTGQAKFPYLGANVSGVDIAPSTVIEKGGVKIGYVGAVTDELPTLVSPAGMKGITVSAPVAAANAEAKKLKDSGEADVVIVLNHEGSAASEFDSAVVDAVIDGHTHETKAENGSPALVQPASYGQLLADIDVVYDKAEKKVVSVKVSNHSAQQVWDACGATPNAAVQSIVNAAKTAADAEGKKVVTNVANEFFRGANTGGETGTNRGTESSLNSLLADAALYGIEKSTNLKPQIGVMNAGGVRADLASGELTFAEAYAVQPFGNSMGVVDITGAQLKGLIEEQWKGEAASRPMLALGFSENVQYAYDPTAAQGERVTQIYVDGKAVDDAATYRVAGATFLLNEGDGFTSFNTVSGSNKIQDSGLMDVDVFNTYLKDHPGLEVRDNQTSVGIHIDGAQEDGTLKAGTEVAIDVSSLAYTASESKPSKVTVELVGQTTAKAEASVDTTITDQHNETGQASVKLTVPEGAKELKITDDNGTTFSLPVNGGAPTPGNDADGSLGSDNSSAGSELDSSSTVGIFAGILGLLALLGGGAWWAFDSGVLPRSVQDQLDALLKR